MTVDFSAGATEAALMPSSRRPQFSTSHWKSSKQHVPRSVVPDFGFDHKSKVVDMVKD
ncbi:hypothetical protein RchiOBHm_Chr2g0158181 [Rosa chinensis]|uniref:Uncharacterized protein n=1 Tax=Rosa chinensis TaxID=74649 RepID=A0A2P6S1X9_ROSCH|nr:hypothetical protein RchiOBHm_Chr2g0158181 [Rosa chinensis]